MRESLSVASDALRSAAAVAVAGLEDGGAIGLLKKQLAEEKVERVVLDLLIAIGLVGIGQDADDVEQFAQKAQSAAVRELASLVHKVLVNKVDRALLQDIHEERLASLSGRWVYRFRRSFMEEVRYGMDLDTILRRVGVVGSASGGTETEDEGGGSQEEGGDGSGGEEQSDPPSGEIPAPGEGEVTTPPGQGSQGNFNLVRRRVIVRGEVVEWDILHWFEELDYFPREIFFTR